MRDICGAWWKYVRGGREYRVSRGSFGVPTAGGSTVFLRSRAWSNIISGAPRNISAADTKCSPPRRSAGIVDFLRAVSFCQIYPFFFPPIVSYLSNLIATRSFPHPLGARARANGRRSFGSTLSQRSPFAISKIAVNLTPGTEKERTRRPAAAVLRDFHSFIRSLFPASSPSRLRCLAEPLSNVICTYPIISTSLFFFTRG